MFFFVQVVLARLAIEIVEHAACPGPVGLVQSFVFDGVHQRMQQLDLALDFLMGVVEELENGDGDGRGTLEELLFTGLGSL